MELPPIEDRAADGHMPAIFGQSHELLAEVARRAAREAADAHVRAGRLAPTRSTEPPETKKPADGGES